MTASILINDDFVLDIYLSLYGGDTYIIHDREAMKAKAKQLEEWRTEDDYDLHDEKIFEAFGAIMLQAVKEGKATDLLKDEYRRQTIGATVH